MTETMFEPVLDLTESQAGMHAKSSTWHASHLLDQLLWLANEIGFVSTETRDRLNATFSKLWVNEILLPVHIETHVV